MFRFAGVRAWPGVKAKKGPRQLLDGERVGLWDLTSVPPGASLERFHGAGFIEMDHGIELVRERRVEIMACALGIRPVNHANRALEPSVTHCPGKFIVVPERQQEPR